jgi:outer membrane lipoprotein SlyB
VSLLRRTGGLRTVRPNAVGWVSVLGPGAAVGALVGHATGRRIGRSTCGGAVAAWMVAVTIDSHRWRRSPVTFQVDDLDPGAVRVVVARLCHDGVPAEVDEIVVGDPPGPGLGVRVPMRHRRAAEAALGITRR